VQLGWSLPLVFYTYAKRALETLSGVDYGLGNVTLEDSFLRRMSYLELAARDLRGGDNFKVGDWHEVPDFQLALANDGQSRRLHAADTDHSARALPKNDSRGAGQRQVVNLVGLPARHSGGVKPGIFGIGFCPAECVADGL
jgi:hypothetical protein